MSESQSPCPTPQARSIPSRNSSPEEYQARVRHLMAILAPGMPIRAGLERIVRGHTGALIVLGDSEKVWEVASGGFVLDAQLTPQALRELCKMDGGLILSEDLERIKAAGVHFVPDGDLPTMETGTRHRSADQVSQQTGVPVVVVSASMSTMAIFLEGERHPIMEPNQLLAQANQALDTLASYRERLSVAAMNLSILEVRDSVAVDDVVQVGRRIEMFRRIDSEVRNYVSGLGVQGRLIQLQRKELVSGVDDLARLVSDDYRPRYADPSTFSISALSQLTWEELDDPRRMAEAIGFDLTVHNLGSGVSPRGHRQLAAISDLSPRAAQAVVDHFGTLRSIVAASTSELSQIAGVGSQRARIIREQLQRTLDDESDPLNG